jgi:DNA-binding transcriptional MerR regulator
MTNGYLLNDAARLAGVRGYQIAYAIRQGYLPEPQQWFNRQRVFTDEDVARIKAYFADRPKRGFPGVDRKGEK